MDNADSSINLQTCFGTYFFPFFSHQDVKENLGKNPEKPKEKNKNHPQTHKPA